MSYILTEKTTIDPEKNGASLKQVYCAVTRFYFENIVVEATLTNQY